jgi:alpha-beta hydrolase superfamily lysophospholipase
MNDTSKPKRSAFKTITSWVLHFLLIAVAVGVTIILVSAFASRKMPDLEKWHREPLGDEFAAKDLSAEYGLGEYLKLEDKLFAEVGDYMLDPDKLDGHSPFSRFVRGGPQDPGRQPRNWNRSVELLPLGELKGGVLLLHGLSDSPYSLRSQAELLQAQGYYVLVLRMPGHGTVPAGLLEVTWQEWAAAVKMGARHVRGKIGEALPFYMGGYSNGGALAVQYTLGALEKGEPVPDRLFLFSPAIGITAFARAVWWDSLCGFIPYFEKSKWLGIESEYDPYKYNSFTKNAGTQSWQLAQEIQRRLAAVKKKGLLDQIPPILAFQSIVDATVEAEVLVTGLFNHLTTKGNEVVFFDINRSEKLDSFLALEFAHKLDRLMKEGNLEYTVTKVGNRNRETDEISARSRRPGVTVVEEESLALKWPARVFSLAHVAIPFPEDDPLYGAVAPEPPVFGLNVGSFHPIGEKYVLKVPPSQLIRIRHNPFHAYMNQRMLEAMGENAMEIKNNE